MKVRLAYGRHGLEVQVPDSATVVSPGAGLPPVADGAAAVRRALAQPVSGPSLDSVVRSAGPAATVAVVFPDLTRPMPNRTVLPPLLDELARAGAGPGRVQLLCATGTHRAASTDEMDELIGADLRAAYGVHQHDADDGDHVAVGTVEGCEVRLDRRWVEAGVRLCTGFVEPHFFAGFSGGPKGVCPGLADTATIVEAHSPARIADPLATWGVTAGNPVHDFVTAAAALVPPDLSLDVTIDGERRLTSVHAGPLPAGHRAACALVEAHLMAPVDGLFDVVLSTNGGYPLDRNLYQAVKGMAAAERVVRPGGTIVVAAACQDGVPDGGAFAELLAAAPDAAALAQVPREGRSGRVDGWQAQVLGRVMARAKVGLYSGGLTADQITGAHLDVVDDVGSAVAAALTAAGPGARLCVLPQGPLAVANVT